jgi:hypothetical protein
MDARARFKIDSHCDYYDEPNMIEKEASTTIESQQPRSMEIYLDHFIGALRILF